MFDFLNFEGPFAQTVYKIFNMIIISALWLLFCIPLFTAGASTTALYYTVQKSLKNNRGNSWQCFWESFKSNFKQSTVVQLVLLAVTFVMVTDIQIVNTFREEGVTGGYMRIFFIIVLVLLAIYAFWIYAYIARFQSKLKEVLKNSLYMAIVHLPITVIVAAIGAGACFLIYLVWPLVFIMPTVSVWLMSYFTEKVFRRYMSEDDRELEDELNMDWSDNYAGKRRGKSRNRENER